MLKWLCENYQGELHISTGMTTKSEIDDLDDGDVDPLTSGVHIFFK